MSNAAESPRDVIRRLRGLDHLAKNDAWLELFVPFLEVKQAEHEAGVSSRGLTPEQRAEHVEAVHLCKELQAWLEAQRKVYQARYRAFTEADIARAEGAFS